MSLKAFFLLFNLFKYMYVLLKRFFIYKVPRMRLFKATKVVFLQIYSHLKGIFLSLVDLKVKCDTSYSTLIYKNNRSVSDPHILRLADTS